ncbi:MAG: hypothetical protein P9M13_04905 [Candidatus Ancaeobacter aquaticus]|nr:hypothetical protein [Candidatus Ancaeobacter aquaticus]
MELYTPSAKNALRNSFWLVFDNIGILIVFNLIFLLSSSLLITIPLSCGAIFHVTQKIIENKETTLADYYRGILLYGIRFSLTYGAYILIIILCLINIMFYTHFDSLLSLVLLGWTILFLLTGLLMALYISTLILTTKNIFSVLKTSFVFLATNLIFSLKIFLLLALLTTAFLLTLAPFFFILFSFVAMFLNCAYIEVTTRYTGKKLTYAHNRSFVKEFLVPPRA